MLNQSTLTPLIFAFDFLNSAFLCMAFSERNEGKGTDVFVLKSCLLVLRKEPL